MAVVHDAVLRERRVLQPLLVKVRVRVSVRIRVRVRDMVRGLG